MSYFPFMNSFLPWRINMWESWVLTYKHPRPFGTIVAGPDQALETAGLYWLATDWVHSLQNVLREQGEHVQWAVIWERSAGLTPKTFHKVKTRLRICVENVKHTLLENSETPSRPSALLVSKWHIFQEPELNDSKLLKVSTWTRQVPCLWPT